MNQFSIAFHDVEFSYTGREDFRLSMPFFKVNAFERTILTGENGGGKSTLLKLAAGILRPLSGKVLHAGDDIAILKLGHIARSVGYLFQEPGRQLFAPTVMEELCFPLTLTNADAAHAEERAREMLKKFGLLSLIERAPHTLSRGEKQRLALAGAMMNSTKMLLLDEPTTGLDDKNVELLLGALDESGAGALIISHDARVLAGGGRVVRVMGGRICEE